MDDSDILQKVADGELDPSDIDSFRNLDPEIQDLVDSGDISVEEALELE